MRGPFTILDARRAGLQRWHLEGASWKRVGRGSYVWSGLPDTDMLKLIAAARRLPPVAAFSGFTAAWLHGIDISRADIEVTVPEELGVRARSGIRVRRATLSEQDVVRIRSVRATAILRTIADVCGRLDLVEAVAIADSALHSRRVTVQQLTEWAKRHAGRPGIVRLKRVISLAEPASESPMESRLRMVLVLAGLPKPKSPWSMTTAGRMPC